MKERGILRKEVEDAISNPDKIQRENNRIVVSKKIDERKIEVVYVVENHKKVILTCYYI
jgi:hypothetical protein